VYSEYPDVVTIAEESTAWPQVSRPTYLGGLGFGYKWDMGWMHDTLDYLHFDPIFRRYHHDRVTFRQVYASSENFTLPLSHDEVVYGKGSLIAKMPGDEWRKFANLRLLFGYQFAQQGKKLQFMGGELGQWKEWNHDAQLDWELLDRQRSGTDAHRGVQRWVRDLNTCYRAHPALHEFDCDGRGFEWIDASDHEGSVLSWIRRGSDPGEEAIIVCNFTPTPRYNYRLGAPHGGHWSELLNSDAPLYGGSGQGNLGGVQAAPISYHGRPYMLTITVPPLGIVVFKRAKGG
jgi:1,4-alpha-glucan branching enzyme